MQSPSFDLLVFVRDTIARDTRLDSLDPDLFARADRFIRMAPALFDAGEDNEILRRDFLTECDEITSALDAKIDLPRMTHSLVISWQDGDLEQGTFGTTVRAWSNEHAEALARAEMENLEEPGDSFDGSVIEHSKGAAWLAERMEATLRKLVDVAIVSALDGDVLREAKSIIAEIDAL